MARLYTNVLAGFLAVSLGAFSSACRDPLEADGEHLEEIDSVVITDGAGVEVANLRAGRWDFAGGGSALPLRVGQAREVGIFFVAEDGDRFQLPGAGGEFTLHVSISNTAIARYENRGPERGAFVGSGVGSTQAVIQALHGSHPDWASDPLPIQVTPN